MRNVAAEQGLYKLEAILKGKKTRGECKAALEKAAQLTKKKAEEWYTSMGVL